MNVARLAAWRDLAVILLALQALVFGVLVSAVTYRLWHALRLLHQRLRPVLFEARELTCESARQTQRRVQALAMSFVNARSVAEGALASIRSLVRRYR